MNYPCGIIRDLLPLYIDDVCNAESKQAVEQHLSDCETCRECYERMKSSEGFAEKTFNELEEGNMADSLKKIKNKLNRKIRNIVLAVVAAAVVFVSGFYLLFEAAIMNVPLEDVTVSANVYPLVELAGLSEDAVPDSDTVTIYSDEKDVSPKVDVKIPELGTVTLTEDLIEKCGYVSVVHVSSDYFLRTVEREIVDNVMYISAFKTSVFNNQTTVFNTQMISLDFQGINQIIFVDKDGAETLLWSK